jgi:kynurenine formamidase
VVSGEGPTPVTAIASLDYTVSQFNYPAPPFMAHAPVRYDAIKDNHTDLAREAVHPQDVSDVLHGLALLGSLGLTSGSYVLAGHSCGACLAFQSVLQPPRHYGLGYLPGPPCPAALLGLDGLYDLPALATADGLGASHAHLRDDYEIVLSRSYLPQERVSRAGPPAAASWPHTKAVHHQNGWVIGRFSPQHHLDACCQQEWRS